MIPSGRELPPPYRPWYLTVNWWRLRGRLPIQDGANGSMRYNRAGFGGMREAVLFDDAESIITLVVAILIAYAVVLSLGTIVWAYRDIRSRTQDGWTQAVSALIVLVFNLPGLMLYLVLRPQETLSDVYERRLEAEALMRDMPEPQPACPSCNHSVNGDYLVCPNCRTRLREACANCSRPVELGWIACPYCAAPGPSAGDGAATTTATSQPPQPPSRQAPSPPRATSVASQPPAAPKRAPADQSLWRRLVG